ncbi:MAG: UDP-3-O-(3-hydroxymyristoyl)glucosamine N-acyltransferase [Candidatus Kapaibacterium sp.]|jgi:UDP-3-O-[3-hydroxymyristoyl] glucosamine N-acyltransferase|nr:UDP-3-O-(3-hydroxymyristoyl)glucosamine N-acyltransferase [Candidatus Kapabacteria bacterium]
MINLNVKQIAEILGGEVNGDFSVIINSIAPIEKADKNSITFYYDTRYEDFFNYSKAACIIVSNDVTRMPNPKQAYIKVDKPYHSFVKLLKIIESDKKIFSSGVHKNAVVGTGTIIHDEVSVGANCVLGDNCRISAGVVLKPGVIIYDNVSIGENTTVNSNVVIYDDVQIGKNCLIHAGAVIGSDGFGFIEDKNDGSYEKVPQLGNVIIEDFVEIGANTTIDRALIGSTLIRRGTKIDNLVHIAHNCEIGENTGIAAQTGISGSVISGKRNRFGGQTGIAGHLEISDDVTILAQSGVSKSVTKSGVYFGSPVKEHLKAFKIEAVLRRLPELSFDLEDLKKKVKSINEKIGE